MYRPRAGLVTWLQDILQTCDQPPCHACKREVASDMHEKTSFAIPCRALATYFPCASYCPWSGRTFQERLRASCPVSVSDHLLHFLYPSSCLSTAVETQGLGIPNSSCNALRTMVTPCARTVVSSPLYRFRIVSAYTSLRSGVVSDPSLSTGDQRAARFLARGHTGHGRLNPYRTCPVYFFGRVCTY